MPTSRFPCVSSLNVSYLFFLQFLKIIFNPQLLRAVGYCFHPLCPDGRAGGHPGGWGAEKLYLRRCRKLILGRDIG